MSNQWNFIKMAELKSPTESRSLKLGQRVWSKKAPEFRGRVTAVKGESRKRYMVRWDGFDHDSGEYGISHFLIEAKLVRNG